MTSRGISAAAKDQREKLMGMSPRLMRPRASGNRYALLRTSLVAYWPLNETAQSGNTTAADWTRRGNDLTSNNSVLSTTGIVGLGRNFISANNNYLSVTSKADVQFGDGNWSISIWFYATKNTSGFQHIAAKDSASGREIGLRVQFDSAGSANRVYPDLFYTDGGTLSLQTTVPASITNADFINRWRHCVVTHNSGLITVYSQGASIATSSRGTGKVFNTTSTQFEVGRRTYSGFTEPFDGVIDEVAKWTRALSSTEVSQLYNSGSGIDLRA